MSKFNKKGYMSTNFSKTPENKFSHHLATGSCNVTEKIKMLIYEMYLLLDMLFHRKSALIKNKHKCNLE